MDIATPSSCLRSLYSILGSIPNGAGVVFCFLKFTGTLIAESYGGRHCNIRRICCLFPTGIELDYIVLRRIYLDIGKLIASSLRALS